MAGTLGKSFGDGTEFRYTHSFNDADLLQKLICSLEGEMTWTPAGKAAEWLTDATANAGAGMRGVKVLTLTDEAGNPKQDQLVYVPEPTTVLLLACGLICGIPFARSVRR